MSLTDNKTKIQELITTINNLPEAGSGGVELPTLTNPAEATKVLAGEQYINENGEAITGTMPNNGTISTTIDGLNTKTATIPEGYTTGGAVTVDDTVDNIANEQADLIAQAISALENKVAATQPQVTLQEKTVSPTTSKQTVTADSGYDGLSKVTVNAMTTATQATPSISISSAGLITASSTQSAGYVTAGTKSATKQLTVQAAKTITPSTSSQTAVAKDVYTTGTVTVGAIPSTYVRPTTTKTATTYTPTTSNQTIAAGTYCSGAQTIQGDANLVAGNIKNGVSIFGVAGTYNGGGSSGGSSGIETCTVSLSCDGPVIIGGGIGYYMNGQGSYGSLILDAMTTTTYNVQKNSIIVFSEWTSMSNVTGNAEELFYMMNRAAYFVSGDCTFTYMG